MQDPETPGALALVGPGRAGATVAAALQERGWRVTAVAGRSPEAGSTLDVAAILGAEPVGVGEAGREADLVVLATPDAAIREAAIAVAPSVPAGSLLVHLAGSLGLAVFHPVRRFRGDLRFGALHPLVSIPSVTVGLDRLPGAWCAVAGDPRVRGLAAQLGMHAFEVADADRPRYHAAAAVAANHLVALLGQVERLARAVGVPFEAFLPLVRASVENTAELGPRAALTGPVARGDQGTVARHLASLPRDERAAYRALAREALRLVDRQNALLAALLEEQAGDDEPVVPRARRHRPRRSVAPVDETPVEGS
ncbi:MAG: DUF2520 domain-containing protein [Acidimicrobiia bacterium]|nr:DUF2520 domain-containing protein [Acidimicrobiia bacterium]